MPIQLPPPPVQAFPAGFLASLGIKNGGQNPSPALTGLQPVIDMWQFYAFGFVSTIKNDIITVPLGGGGTYSAAALKVPNGKIWYCTNLEAVWGTMATPGNFPFVVVADSSLFTRGRYDYKGPTSSTFSTPIYRNEGFWMGSGWNIGAGHWGPAGATAVNVTINVQVTEFQA